MVKKQLNDKWDKILVKHKRAMVAVTNGDKHAFRVLKETGEKLALHYANYQCSHPMCTKKLQLTIHHVVERKYREYFDYTKYVSMRNYWNYLVILCRKHHSELHNMPDTEQMPSLDSARIDRIKKSMEFIKFKDGVEL